MKDPCSSSRLMTGALLCGVAVGTWASLRTGRRREVRGAPAARLFRGAASLLAGSVLADSSLGHYSGCFANPAMFVAPAVSIVTLAESGGAALHGSRPSRARAGLFGAGVLTGLVGLAFHLFNVGKREGSFSWPNFFYGAPVGAPGALVLAGLCGLAGERLSRPPPERGRGTGLLARAAAAISALGLLGTVGEALLLHFRGAFQDPFMALPATIPPTAALALGAAAVRPTPRLLRAASKLLKLTGLLGIAGTGFHAFGVHRNMGGWRNWSQMILQGPPLPAPPGFTGIALAGLGAVRLLRSREEPGAPQEQAA